MGSTGYIGQTLDDKYQIERELGRGGMGTVYLATHLGTERPVAVKIVSPQYMRRTEFVERFRREARAAGRLRHPNVVNVTDFGFAETGEGRVAYLVMEYLDGCTLGEILEEEKNLPVGWTLDILEQVCSAVHEAHAQGIIHRDLKPDNIWLEPNQRGGYTVKVLDFGIAKLEEPMSDGDREAMPEINGDGNPRLTFSGSAASETMTDAHPKTLFGEAGTMALAPEGGTLVSEAGTLIQVEPHSEAETALFGDSPLDGDAHGDGTRLISETDEKRGGSSSTERSGVRTSSDLTRVGAVLGTPLYMSPEQCRGERLDARSDIYSLGVIAYQMLSGATPFNGEYTQVMEAHRLSEPEPLKVKKARRKMRKAIHRALAKERDGRPATAEAFASEMRARSEGIFGLLRRAMVIYSEHLPKFLMLTAFFSLPIIVLTLALMVVAFLQVSGSIGDAGAETATAILGITLAIVSVFCSYLNIGTITWVVSQYLAVPLRPVRVRPALREARRKWKTFAGTGMMNTLLIFVFGFLSCAAGLAAGLLASLLSVPFFGWTKGQVIFGIAIGSLVGIAGFAIAHVIWMLVAPVVMMENLRGRTAMRRSYALVRRSIMTTAAASLIIFLIPAVLAASIAVFINLAATALDKTPAAAAAVGKTDEGEDAKAATSEQPDQVPETKKPRSILGLRIANQSVHITNKDDDMRTQVEHTLLQSINQVVWLPIEILVISFSAIIVALLYLKTRLSGGETLNQLMERFEDDDRPRRKWQERVRQRLIQSGRATSKP